MWLQVVHQWGCNFESDISSCNRRRSSKEFSALVEDIQSLSLLQFTLLPIFQYLTRLHLTSSSSSPHSNCPIISVRKAKPPINAYFLAPVRLSSPTVVWCYTNIQILWYYKYYTYDDDCYTNMSVTQISLHQSVYLTQQQCAICSMCFMWYVRYVLCAIESIVYLQ